MSCDIVLSTDNNGQSASKSERKGSTTIPRDGSTL